MDDNNDVTAGTPSDGAGASPMPESQTAGTPLASGGFSAPSRAIDTEGVRKVGNLWEDLGMTPPVPVENPSYRSAAKTVTEMPDAAPDPFTATLLFPSQPDGTRAVSPLSPLSEVGAPPPPDPSTRITSLPVDAPVVSFGEPAPAPAFALVSEADLTAPPLFAPDQQSLEFTSIPQPEAGQVGLTDDPSVKAFFSDEPAMSAPVVGEAPVGGAPLSESPLNEADWAQIPFDEVPSVTVSPINGHQAFVSEVPPTMTMSTPPATYASVPEQLPLTQTFVAQAVDVAGTVGTIETAGVVEGVEGVAEGNLAIAAPAASDPLAAEPTTAEFVGEETVEVEEEPVEKGISVITREATVLGDIITEGHIDIVGRVKGNIDAQGDVAIHGIVRGDVGGSKIGLYNCRVKGNLDAGLGVIVDENSIIGGDVRTKNIIFDGKVKGNIDAGNVVVLRSHSYCLGDVQAASLAVEPGAVLNGKVRTFVEGDLEAPFDEVL